MNFCNSLDRLDFLKLVRYMLHRVQCLQLKCFNEVEANCLINKTVVNRFVSENTFLCIVQRVRVFVNKVMGSTRHISICTTITCFHVHYFKVRFEAWQCGCKIIARIMTVSNFACVYLSATFQRCQARVQSDGSHASNNSFQFVYFSYVLT